MYVKLLQITTLIKIMKKITATTSSFRKIIEKDFLYVDKTKIIYDLITNDEYYFLSRPRRFGKTLLISTLEELFLAIDTYLKAYGSTQVTTHGSDIPLFL